MSSKEFDLLMRLIYDLCEKEDLETLKKIVRETIDKKE